MAEHVDSDGYKDQASFEYSLELSQEYKFANMV